MSSTVQSVKCSFGEDLRRFPLSSHSFTDLETSLRSIYSLGSSKILLKYQDDENDLISMSSDRELDVAFGFAKQNTLRVFVSLAPNEETAGETSPSPPLVSGETPLENSGEWKGKYDKKLELKYEKFQRKTGNLQKKALKHGAARFVSDTFPDGSVLSPGQEFVKMWTIRNESLESWPQSYQFSFKKGHNMSSVESIDLPRTIAPGEEFQISLPMRAPSTLGKHVGIWRFIGASGRPFGQPFRVKIIVGDGGSLLSSYEVENLEGKLRELAAVGFHDRFLNEKLLRNCRGDMDKVVWKLSKKVNKEKKREEKVARKREKIEKKDLKKERKHWD